MLQIEHVQAKCWSTDAIAILKSLQCQPNLFFNVRKTVDNYYFGDLTYEDVNDKKIIQIKHSLEQGNLAIGVTQTTFGEGNYE